MKRPFYAQYGKFNRSKTLVLVTLARKKAPGYATRELALRTGLPYRSLCTSLKSYCFYGYIERQACYSWGKGDYQYQLTPRGYGWLKRARARLPNFSKFVRELDIWSEAIEKVAGDILALPFAEFLYELNNWRSQFHDAMVRSGHEFD